MPKKRGENQPGSFPFLPTNNNGTRRNTLGEPTVAQNSGSRTRPGSSFAARFGRVILADGIAAIPSALYHYQGKMKLKIQHVWFVSYILSHKWDEDLPYPSLKKMNRSTNLDLRYLQRIRGELCAAGYLEVGIRHREGRGQDTNTYDFSGLFDRLEKLILSDPPSPNPIRDETPTPNLTELAELDSSFVARYGRIIVRRGVAAVPRAIFTHQAVLGLTLQQVWFTTYIFSFQWNTALPYPSIEKMAEQTGYNRTHLHAIKAEMVKQGYLRLMPRINSQGGRDTNAYDFSGLLDAIKSQLQPETQQSKPGFKPSTGSSGKAQRSGMGEIPDLRRPRKVGQAEANTAQSLSGDGQETIHRGGEKATWGGGLKTTDKGGSGYIRRNGHDQTEGGGAEEAGAGGTEITSSVYHGSLRGTVGRRHKEETDNIESEKNDSNHNSKFYDLSIMANTNKTAGDETRPPYSAYIAEVTSDFSNELNDSEHIVSNVTQALRLWQITDLDEQEFISLMYEAKARTRKYQTRPHWDALINKMAYFYSTLRDLCRNTGDTSE